MQTLKRKYDFGRVKSSAIFSELTCFPQVKEQFSPIQKVNDEVEALGCLECKMKLDNERMV
jgi:hypothetical protein